MIDGSVPLASIFAAAQAGRKTKFPRPLNVASSLSRDATWCKAPTKAHPHSPAKTDRADRQEKHQTGGQGWASYQPSSGFHLQSADSVPLGDADNASQSAFATAPP